MEERVGDDGKHEITLPSKVPLNVIPEVVDEYETDSGDFEPILPLDVQIAEGVENNTDIHEDRFEEVIVKTEPAEEDVSSYETKIIQNVKVEILEAIYDEAPVQEFLYNAGIQNMCEVEESLKDANEEFLSILERPKKRPRNSKLVCVKCSAVFRYQSTYDYHVRSQCGSKMIAQADSLVKKGKNQSFLCNICEKTMSSRTSLMVHMRIHNGERPFECGICQRSFTQKAHLKDHMNVHTSKPNKTLDFTCAECGQMFAEKKQLIEHLREHFGDKVFDCDICFKRFRFEPSLKNHKLTHSGKKDFACSVCGKEFILHKSLKTHMRIHTREKPFVCEICGKGFAEKSRKVNHVKRHTGELKQACSVCGKRFACRYDLRIHQRTHTGERPFSCNICCRSFNRKSIMETHMTIHTGRKDFVCTECGEAFNRKSKLEIHLTTHSGETVTCEICHRTFKCKAYLVPHMKTHLGVAQKRIRTKRKTSCIQ